MKMMIDGAAQEVIRKGWTKIGSCVGKSNRDRFQEKEAEI